MGLLRTADLDRLAAAPFSYPDVGATREGPLPAGYVHGQREGVVGSGRADFERAVDAVFGWRMQRGVGLRVRASGSPREPGTVVVLTFGLPGLGYDIPCRVVWSRTDGDEQGFAYGSLRGHPLDGEEQFTIERAGGVVLLRIRSVSRPVGLAGQVPALARAGQRHINRRYAAAARRLAAGDVS